MEDSISKYILMAVSVVLLAALLSAIAFGSVFGFQILGNFQSDMAKDYSKAGLSMMIDASNLESIDAANMYRMIELNRHNLIGYEIRDDNNNLITDIELLLNNPMKRFSVVISGDSTSGFRVVAKEVSGG